MIPCGGCGETNSEKRCIGCLHDFGKELEMSNEETVEHRRIQLIGGPYDGEYHEVHEGWPIPDTITLKDRVDPWVSWRYSNRFDGTAEIGEQIRLQSTNGIEMVTKERLRQIGKGYRVDKDIERHSDGQLGTAAAHLIMAYYDTQPALLGSTLEVSVMDLQQWVLDLMTKQHEDPLTFLAQAGALICAEIDRILLSRVAPPKEES